MEKLVHSLYTLCFIICCVSSIQALTEEDLLTSSENSRDESSLAELARTFFTYNNNYLVTLNTTYVIIAGLVIGTILFGLLALATFLGLVTKPSNTSYYSSYAAPSSGYGPTNRQSQKKRRYQRSLDDFASMMHALEQAFKKYDVEEIECQMFVSCEAAHVSRQDDNGPLAKIIFDIIDKMVSRKDFAEAKMSVEMEAITESFKFGRESERFGTEDGCAPLRHKCFELQNSKKHHGHQF